MPKYEVIGKRIMHDRVYEVGEIVAMSEAEAAPIRDRLKALTETIAEAVKDVPPPESSMESPETETSKSKKK